MAEQKAPNQLFAEPEGFVPLTPETLQDRLTAAQSLARKTARLYQKALKDLEEEKKRAEIFKIKAEELKRLLAKSEEIVRPSLDWSDEDSKILKDNPGWRYFRPYRDIYQQVKKKYPGFIQALNETYRAEKDKNTVAGGIIKIYDESEQIEYLTRKHLLIRPATTNFAETQTNEMMDQKEATTPAKPSPKKLDSGSQTDEKDEAVTLLPACKCEKKGKIPKMAQEKESCLTKNPSVHLSQTLVNYWIGLGESSNGVTTHSHTKENWTQTSESGNATYRPQYVSQETQTTAVGFHLAREIPSVIDHRNQDQPNHDSPSPSNENSRNHSLKRKSSPPPGSSMSRRQPIKTKWIVPPPPGCWNCERMGHRYPICPYPFLRPFCFHCGFKNCTSITCTNCNGKDLIEGVDYHRKSSKR